MLFLRQDGPLPGIKQDIGRSFHISQSIVARLMFRPAEFAQEFQFVISQLREKTTENIQRIVIPPIDKRWQMQAAQMAAQDMEIVRHIMADNDCSCGKITELPQYMLRTLAMLMEPVIRNPMDGNTLPDGTRRQQEPFERIFYRAVTCQAQAAISMISSRVTSTPVASTSKTTRFSSARALLSTAKKSPVRRASSSRKSVRRNPVLR